MPKRVSPSGLVNLDGRRGFIMRSVNGVCTWCGTIVEPPRRTWCSQECVDCYSLTQPANQRTFVFDRDRGVCAQCNVDTIRLERIQNRIRRMIWGSWWRNMSPPHITRYSDAWRAHREAERQRLWKRVGGRRPPPDTRSDLWDLDHIVPIVDAGDPHDPANWQTLCWWCHVKTSAKEARRRASRKREAALDQQDLEAA